MKADRANPTESSRCGGGGVTLSLPVLASKPAKPRSHMGRLRAGVLILVHLLIAAHIVQWLITGSTISPVEPSEAMQTLEVGAVNAGFIFFVLAILATLVFGRYFCGWGCHVVALQDLCTWLMNKLGVRPKPFRSRLLVWAPLGFGLYMFVWPTFKRLALLPGLEAMGIARPVWLREAAEFHGLSSELIVTDFWATFPPWFVAIPFFILIGFAAVYFLGSKGFCTYGCPYGGIFGVVDRFSPGRIVVNSDCHQCGHCTAVCTSNVRVHEEVRDFGMVVDPGCMKCMDCVSACPNDALSFAMATPPAFRKPVDGAAAARQQKIRSNPKRFDLTWPEEIVLAIVFLGMFLAFRGMFNLVPMLMAAGMAGVGAFLAWKGWCLVTRPNVRVQSLVLRKGGRFSALGGLAFLLAIGVVGSSIWSGAVNTLRYAGRLDHQRLDIPISIVMRPEFSAPPETSHIAKRGLRAFTRSEAIGWALNAEQKRELAYLALVSGDSDRASMLMAEIVRTGNPTDELVRQLLALRVSGGAQPAEQLILLVETLQIHPELRGLAPDIARLKVMLGAGSLEAADAFWEDLLENEPDSDHVSLMAAEYYLATRRPDRATVLLPELSSIDGLDAGVVGVRVLLKLDRLSEAKDLLEGLSGDERLNHSGVRVLASLWIAMAEPERALELVQTSLERTPESSGLNEFMGQLLLAAGDRALARASFAEATLHASEEPWALLSLAESITLAGLQSQDSAIRDIGLSAYESAARMEPTSSLIAHDRGQALLASGVVEEGLASLERAVELSPESTHLRDALRTARQRLGME